MVSAMENKGNDNTTSAPNLSIEKLHAPAREASIEQSKELILDI
jgi:hypothetical protein